MARTLGGRGWSDADPDRLVWVDSRDIRWYLDIRNWRQPRLSPYDPKRGRDARRFVAENAGKVLGGDWDRVRVPFEENDIFRLLYDRFELGKEWQESEIYRKFASDIGAGLPRWHWSRSLEELERTARQTDELYRNIVTNGYQPAPGRGGGHPGDEVTVCIGRGGELIYVNVGGHHRLSIAKILGLRSIPVRVLVRHEEWQQVRRRLRNDPALPAGDRLARHPDLADLLPERAEAGVN